jgi:hypothetical protein
MADTFPTASATMTSPAQRIAPTLPDRSLLVK